MPPCRNTATNPKSNTPSSTAAPQAPTWNYSPDTNTPAGTYGETTSPATQHYNQKVFGAQITGQVWNMTGKTWQGPHENQSRTEPGSIADHIAAALCSTEAQAYMPVAGLPLAPLPPPMPSPSLYCVLTPIDDRGRLADRSPIRALGWPPGQPITISVVQQTVVVISGSHGAQSLTRHGHLATCARFMPLTRRWWLYRWERIRTQTERLMGPGSSSDCRQSLPRTR
jgi:hypothetical protein